MNALQHQIPVDSNVLSPFNVLFSNKATKNESLENPHFTLLILFKSLPSSMTSSLKLCKQKQMSAFALK